MEKLMEKIYVIIRKKGSGVPRRPGMQASSLDWPKELAKEFYYFKRLAFLQKLSCDGPWYPRSAYAESFMGHLRALCHFFQGYVTPKSFPDDVFAREELPEWSAFIDHRDTKRLDFANITRISKRVAHITMTRGRRQR
jgi:hypothetical protein